jgi:flagellar biosynthesis protein FliR
MVEHGLVALSRASMPRPIALDATWMTTVGLLSLRLAAVFLLTPILAAASVPVTVRVLLVLGLAAALSLALPGSIGLPPRTTEGLFDSTGFVFRAAFTELALGAMLALGVLLGFAAFSMAGELLGVQIGFGLAQVIDPASNASVPLLTSAFQQVAVLVFFLIDGHHALLRGVACSLECFPLGQPWSPEAALAPILGQVAGLFSLGFALAAPVAFSLLLVEMGLCAIARNLPQMNMIAVGIPFKVVMGLLALSLWLGGMRTVMTRVYASMFRTWDAVFERASTSGDSVPAARGPRASGSESATAVDGAR